MVAMHIEGEVIETRVSRVDAQAAFGSAATRKRLIRGMTVRAFSLCLALLCGCSASSGTVASNVTGVGNIVSGHRYHIVSAWSDERWAMAFMQARDTDNTEGEATALSQPSHITNGVCVVQTQDAIDVDNGALSGYIVCREPSGTLVYVTRFAR